MEAKMFCMSLTDGERRLDRNHQYFFQVQLQLFVTKKVFCDFIMWSQAGIRIEGIYCDDDFILEHLPATTHFFKYALLPELVGKWMKEIVSNEEGIMEEPAEDDYTETPSTSEGDAGRLWCFCEQPSTDEQVTCDNIKCSIKNFHMGCLHLSMALSTMLLLQGGGAQNNSLIQQRNCVITA